MANDDMPPEDKFLKPEPDSEEPERRKSRRHGYRGYPNNPDIGGSVHTGSGFAGVGAPDTTGLGPSQSGIIGDKTRESVEELGEEEEEKK